MVSRARCWVPAELSSVASHLTLPSTHPSLYPSHRCLVAQGRASALPVAVAAAPAAEPVLASLLQATPAFSRPYCCSTTSAAVAAVHGCSSRPCCAFIDGYRARHPGCLTSSLSWLLPLVPAVTCWTNPRLLPYQTAPTQLTPPLSWLWADRGLSRCSTSGCSQGPKHAACLATPKSATSRATSQPAWLQMASHCALMQA
jgi:hypothetical protein